MRYQDYLDMRYGKGVVEYIPQRGRKVGRNPIRVNDSALVGGGAGAGAGALMGAGIGLMTGIGMGRGAMYGAAIGGAIGGIGGGVFQGRQAQRNEGVARIAKKVLSKKPSGTGPSSGTAAAPIRNNGGGGDGGSGSGGLAREVPTEQVELEDRVLNRVRRLLKRAERGESLEGPDYPGFTEAQLRGDEPIIL